MIFIFPTESEAARFRVASPTSRVVICGVGMAQCAATTARVARDNPSERLILAGIAGSYDLERTPLCEVVEVVSEVVGGLPERFASRHTVSPILSLRGVSSNTVSVADPNFEGADIENMEGAPFMAVAEALGIQHTQIRAISNKVGDPFSKWKIEEALEALTRELVEIEKLNVIL